MSWGCTTDLCLVSEPLKSAVANFRKAAAHLDEVILSLDLANETWVYKHLYRSIVTHVSLATVIDMKVNHLPVPPFLFF